MAWPEGGALDDAVREVLPLPIEASASAPTDVAALAVAFEQRAPSPSFAARSSVIAGPMLSRPARPIAPQATELSHPAGLVALPSPALPVGDRQPPAEILPPTAPLPALPSPQTSVGKRLSFSSWVIARSGGGAGSSAYAPQLGGTQGGLRVDYALIHGLAATARIAAPAAGAGRELSLGIAWRPAGVPLRVVAEHRIALDGARGGPSVGVSGGVDAARLPAGFRLEGYGQAGVIIRNGVEHFIDGSARATRGVAELGTVKIDAGAGLWGGAQRGVARLDVGPTIGARVPILGPTVRIAVDWRQRVAGHARPGSGPALSVGMDF